MAPLLTRLGAGGGGGGFGFGRKKQGGGVAAVFSATGGNLNYSDPQYSFFIFTSPGTFSVQQNTIGSTAEVFVVGGGGGGGGGGDERNATGGGAGGIVFANIPAPNITAGSYPVNVGTGGEGGSVRSVNSTQGGDSTFGYSGNTLTGQGGGRGADWDRNPSASPGGSGGGYDPSQYSPKTAGTGTQPTANSGNGHIVAQFGTPGGATWGGAAGPGALPYYTPGPSFGPTVGAVYPGQSYGLNQGSGGWGCGGGLGSGGGNGIVIIRTLKSTP